MNVQAYSDLDTFRQLKAAYYQGKVSAEVAEAAATKVLENTIAAEIKIKGRAVTKINKLAIARMMR
jgi:hypothetical protein